MLLISKPEVFRSILWLPNHGSDLLCLPGHLCTTTFPSSAWMSSRDGVVQVGGEGALWGSRTVQSRMHRDGTLLQVMRMGLAQVSALDAESLARLPSEGSNQLLCSGWDKEEV